MALRCYSSRLHATTYSFWSEVAKYSNISLRAQSARVLHLNRSVLRSGKREKGQITAVCALRGFRTRGLETRSLSPSSQCMSNTNTRVAERMLPRLWFIQVSVRSGCHGLLATRGGVAGGSPAVQHIQYTHIH